MGMKSKYHYKKPTKNEHNMAQHTWIQRYVDKDYQGRCTDCGGWFDKHWNVNYDKVTECAPCYFKGLLPDK